MSKHQAFPTQRADEHLIIMIRRHWIGWARFIATLVAFNIFPVIVFAVMYFLLGWELDPEGPLFVVIAFATSLFYLNAWLMYFHEFIDYRLDVWILTDQRIINIEQEGLFSRTISELNIARVQDVTSEVQGHLQTLLDYGNVYVQTAGEQQRFIFENVPHPEEISRLVVRANDAATQRIQAELHGQAPVPESAPTPAPAYTAKPNPEPSTQEAVVPPTQPTPESPKPIVPDTTAPKRDGSTGNWLNN